MVSKQIMHHCCHDVTPCGSKLAYFGSKLFSVTIIYYIPHSLSVFTKLGLVLVTTTIYYFNETAH